jgi:hypothetical protein
VGGLRRQKSLYLVKMKKDEKSGSIEAKYVYSLHQRWNISVGQNCLNLEK